MMDRKDKRTPVTEIFPREEQSKEHMLPVRTQIEKFEEKARLNFNKNRPAPQPPGRNFILPKIGNYQPKSLLLSSEKNGTKTEFQKLNDKNENVEEPKKYMIIGDKDTPITIHQSSDVIDSPPENEFFPRFGSDNPVYEPEEMTSTNTTENDSMLDFDKTVKNPLFEENDDIIPSQQKASDVEMIDVSSSISEVETKPAHKKRPAPPPPVFVSQTEESEAGIPAPDYEPEPDYDEEDITKTTDVYPPPIRSQERQQRRQSAAREYEGEDFSKYMHDSEDEDYFSDYTYTSRSKIKYKRKAAPNRPVSHPGKKDSRPKTKQHQVKSTGPSASEEEGRRKTIRDFSFNDCKIGYDDRTVKSTSAAGRYMKRGKDRLPLQQVSSASYEDFLRSRYTENGSNGSADSGHETGDDFDVHAAADLFRQSQPKQFKTGSKQSLWEKLTWRFKRNSRGYAMT